MMTELDSFDDLRTLLVDQHGWTLLTAVNLMLFSLLHNPCATTIMTIYKETLSRKWATIGALMPLGLAFIVTLPGRDDLAAALSSAREAKNLTCRPEDMKAWTW